MKMREVCAKTGLTERTVRYWAAEKLFAPRTYEMNDRVYFDFTEADVALLEEIAALRRAGFSVAQVAAMQRDGEKLPALVREVRENLQREAEERRRCAEALLGAEDCATLSELAAKLRADAEHPQADPEPDFGRFELQEPEERRRRYASYAPEQEEKTRKRLLWRNFIAAALLALLAMVLTLACTGHFPRRETPPEPDWAARISGGFALPVTVVCAPETKMISLGTDGPTGRAAALLELDGREIALLFRILGEAEAEFLRESDYGAWQTAPSEGEFAAVSYFRVDGSTCEALALCEGEPIGLLTRAGVELIPE